MKNVAVIGLSNFGTFLCCELCRLGVEVLAVDIDEARVKEVAEIATRVVVADATDKEALSNLGLEDMDRVVISVGPRIDASILIALFLGEFGVTEILVKALNENHEKILRKIGVKQIVIPERDAALRQAQRIQNPHLVDLLTLGEGYSVIELATPTRWVGKSLAQLHILKDHHVQVTMIRGPADETYRFPRGDSVVHENDILVLGGRDEDLERIERL